MSSTLRYTLADGRKVNVYPLTPAERKHGLATHIACLAPADTEIAELCQLIDGRFAAAGRGHLYGTLGDILEDIAADPLTVLGQALIKENLP
jgi:hypothetical protein